jgi:hypothetical protein
LLIREKLEIQFLERREAMVAPTVELLVKLVEECGGVRVEGGVQESGGASCFIK